MSRAFISMGARKVAVDVILNEREWERHLKNFRNHGKYRDTGAALFFIAEPRSSELFLRTAKDHPWIYFALYQDVMEDFENAKVFQEGCSREMDLQTFLLFGKNAK